MFKTGVLFLTLVWILQYTTANMSEVNVVPNFEIMPVEHGLLVKWFIQDYTYQSVVYHEIEIHDDHWKRVVRGNGNTSSVLIERLQPCHFYKVAVTTVIVWNFQMQTTWKCGTPLPKAPRKVRALQLENLSSGSNLMLSWKKPADISPDCSLHYMVILRRSGGYELELGFDTDGTHLIDNLQSSTTYYVKVQALHGGLRGEMSDIVTETTSAGESPVAPYDVNLISSTSGVNLTWKMPPGESKNILQYLMEFNGVFYEIPNDGRTYFLVQHLEECNWYCINVAAVSTNHLLSKKATTCGTPLQTRPCSSRQFSMGAVDY